MKYRFETGNPEQAKTIEADSFEQALAFANESVREPYALVFTDDADPGMTCFEITPEEGKNGTYKVTAHRRIEMVLSHPPNAVH
jgi:hypothetical protein